MKEVWVVLIINEHGNPEIVQTTEDEAEAARGHADFKKAYAGADPYKDPRALGAFKVSIGEDLQKVLRVR